jgi:hypothetical protein
VGVPVAHLDRLAVEREGDGPGLGDGHRRGPSAGGWGGCSGSTTPRWAVMRP